MLNALLFLKAALPWVLAGVLVALTVANQGRK